MPKALISSNESVTHITGWTEIPTDKPNQTQQAPTVEVIPNSYRIAEIEDTTFDVNPALFWVDCNSAVDTMNYYYDSSDSTIKVIVNVPEPS